MIVPSIPNIVPFSVTNILPIECLCLLRGFCDEKSQEYLEKVLQGIRHEPSHKGQVYKVLPLDFDADVQFMDIPEIQKSNGIEVAPHDVYLSYLYSLCLPLDKGYRQYVLSDPRPIISHNTLLFENEKFHLIFAKNHDEKLRIHRPISFRLLKQQNKLISSLYRVAGMEVEP